MKLIYWGGAMRAATITRSSFGLMNVYIHTDNTHKYWVANRLFSRQTAIHQNWYWLRLLFSCFGLALVTHMPTNADSVVATEATCHGVFGTSEVYRVQGSERVTCAHSAVSCSLWWKPGPAATSSLNWAGLDLFGACRRLRTQSS